MSTYLLLITIGPVQEFIAAARRTRDLWAGSQLLSDLSRKAATFIANHNGTEMIFPFSENKEPDFTEHDVVNRIMAIIKADNISDFTTILQEELKTDFKNYYAKAFEDVKGSFDKGIANAQLDDLLEINWAAVPFKDGDDYKKAREKVEHLLMARKNTRDFVQPNWAKAGQPKSSIDGHRETVIDESLYPERGDDDTKKKQKLNQLWQKFHISGAERLSGVDLFKRHYQPELHPEDDFPSTSHIAALPFIWRYVRATSEYQSLDKQDSHASQQEEAFNKAIEVYAKSLEDIQSKVKIKEKVVHQSSLFTHFMPYDASILYESRLREITDSDELKNRQSDELKKARKDLQAFYERLNTTDRPSPYYAILHADGDGMGQALDGLSSDYTLHQRFSQQLDVFASAVRGIVESHWGALIYSGGDDVLALVPLHSLLPCAKELHDRFDQAWDNFADLASKPTLSVGIAIAHYMEPLSDTLNLARAAEKKAKSFTGKNALAITLSKRSGSDCTIVGSWRNQSILDSIEKLKNKKYNENLQTWLGKENGLGYFYERLLQLIDFYRKDAIPDGFAFELEDLSLRLGSKIDPAILRAEAKRIAKRKQVTDQANPLIQLCERLPGAKEWDSLQLTSEDIEQQKKFWNIDLFVDELVIASELARALGPIATQP